MKQTWIDPKIVLGNSARGSLYYRRPLIEGEILDEIKKGNHILLSAPRRVGKTSIVQYLSEHCQTDMNCIFKNIQEDKSLKDFYKSFYQLILSSLSKNQKALNTLKNFFKQRGIKGVSLDGVEFADKKGIDYAEEIEKVLVELQNNKTKVVLFIDELPDVLDYLYKNGKTEDAYIILKKIRSWRQNYYKDVLSIVWIGSIGLYHIVERIGGRISDLNDLNEIHFKPFSHQESENYIKHVTKNATIKYSNELAKYLIQKIGYTIPYFINLMLTEVNRISKSQNNTSISKEDIDTAFNTIVKENKNFDDYKQRLFDYFNRNDALFMNEILTHIAHKESISIRQLYNLAKKHLKELNYIDFVDILERDGYIVENEKKKYIFISPFLKAFWKRKHPIYES